MNKKILFIMLLAAAAAPARCEMTSKFKADFYGFIKTDAIYSDHGTTTNEYRAYAASGRKDRAFRTSARASRFGFNISTGAAVSGKIEADFLGLTDSVGGTASTTADLRLRHAYVLVKTGKAEFLAGQTFYPVMLLLPETLNDYLLGNSGALWSRAPQVSAAYSPLEKLKLTAAVVRPTAKLTDAEGTHSALPGFQGRAEKEFGKVKVSLGAAAGIWKSTSTQKTADTSLVIAAVSAPLGAFTFSGEAWTGRNLSDFLGGLGNTGYGDKAVPAKGGFAGVKYKASDALWFNAICGVDDPDNDKVLTKGKTRNATALVNAVAKFYDSVEVGLEAASLETRYKDLPARSAMNYQFSVKFIF
ncbi:MAG: hypothetical protein HY952_11780 [Elusimicrobia bacterium]|nr:hypothetical protein [Elusimicrobiota bacterium]